MTKHRTWRPGTIIVAGLATFAVAGFSAISEGANSAGKRVLFPCYDYAAGVSKSVSKPRKCTIDVSYARPLGKDAHTTAADKIDLIKLRWKHWSANRATARGVYAGNMGVRKRSRVMLFGKRSCPAATGYAYYTKFKISIKGDVVFAGQRPLPAPC